MKKSINSPSLEELLASVEHAGRDARRQQQLSEMIEQMAAQEHAAKRRTVRLWTVGFSAAACLLLFVLVLFELHDDPLHPTTGQKDESTLVAQNAIPAVQEAPQPMVALTSHTAVTKRGVPTKEKPIAAQLAHVTVTEDVIPDIETLTVIDYVDNKDFAETVKEESSPVKEEDIVTSFTETEEYASVKEEIPQSEPQRAEFRKTPDEQVKEPRHRSLFQILFTEPDLMEDNTLSFRLI